MEQTQKIRFIMRVPPYRSSDDLFISDKDLRSLGELKYYVRPVLGWNTLGLEFKSNKEFIDWMCANLTRIETENTKTFYKWVLFCYLRNMDPMKPKFGWYLRAGPDQIGKLKEPWRQIKLVRYRCELKPFSQQVVKDLKDLETPKDPAAIADMLCRHIHARLAVPCDSRSLPYFAQWVLYCNSR
jgi:hypothetical protein